MGSTDKGIRATAVAIILVAIITGIFWLALLALIPIVTINKYELLSSVCSFQDKHHKEEIRMRQPGLEPGSHALSKPRQ